MTFIEEVEQYIAGQTNKTDTLNLDDFPFSSFKYIFIPEKHTVIHLIELKNNGLDGNVLLSITRWLLERNLKIIHVWEDVWWTNKDIVKSRLKSLVGRSETIPARLTQLRRINKELLDDFLQKNHLQGTTQAKLKYGLFLPNRYFRVLKETYEQDELLVAVASFSNARKFIRNEVEFRSYEMIRFANLCGFTVVGGLNKLMKGFISEHQPDDIMTYADRDWSDGHSYDKLGFEFVGETPPQSFKVDINTSTRYPNSLNKPNLLTVWNTGNLKYLLKIKSNTEDLNNKQIF